MATITIYDDYEDQVPETIPFEPVQETDDEKERREAEHQKELAEYWEQQKRREVLKANRIMTAHEATTRLSTQEYEKETKVLERKTHANVRRLLLEILEAYLEFNGMPRSNRLDAKLIQLYPSIEMNLALYEFPDGTRAMILAAECATGCEDREGRGCRGCFCGYCHTAGVIQRPEETSVAFDQRCSDALGAVPVREERDLEDGWISRGGSSFERTRRRNVCDAHYRLKLGHVDRCFAMLRGARCLVMFREEL